MKLEMNRAWNQAMALLGANRDVILIVAGVFFFLPYVVFMLLMPDMGSSVSDPADTEAAMARLGDFYGQLWWLVALVSLVQGIGMLGLLALLTDHRRPTVAEALKIGVAKVLPYIAAYLIAGLGVGLLAILVIGVPAAAGSPAVSFVGVLAFVVLLFYAMTKFSLVPPILVKEGVSNPLTALARSWRLTKGNSLRLFFFYALLVVALVVVMMVLTMVIGLLLGLLGGDALRFGNAVLASLMNAVWATGFLAVLSAVHDQLGGTSAAQIAETFE